MSTFGAESMSMALPAAVGGGAAPLANVPGLANVVQAPSVDAGAEASSPATQNRSNRTKYACPCGHQVWGKPKLNIICGECGEAFEAHVGRGAGATTPYRRGCLDARPIR